MPYETIQSLPESIQNVLPKHAQEIYKESFNHALEQYKDPKNRRNKNEDLEIVAHKVAWSAVKQKYKKKDNKWVLKKINT